MIPILCRVVSLFNDGIDNGKLGYAILSGYRSSVWPDLDLPRFPALLFGEETEAP